MSPAEFQCRSCDSGSCQTILDLGRTPLANALLTETQLELPEPTHPLRLVFCPDCALVQIDETVPPDQLFSDYPYFSSFADTMVAHAESLAERLIAQRGLTERHLVVEPASNDGYLLQHYAAAGVRVLGIEPAINIAAVARDKGIETINDFFSCELAARLRHEGRAADVIHTHNVLAHVADLNGFIEGVATLLADGGLYLLEVPYVRDMIEHVEFDTIYHEHLCYFSLIALQHLFERHGLTITHAERVPIHGGTIQVHAQRAGEADATVAHLLDEERELGLDRFGHYAGFADRVAELRETLRSQIAELKAEGMTIAAYGASAKGSTLLNSFGLGCEEIDYVVDRSHHKQGKFTPGTHLRIEDPTVLVERMPDAVLLLTWNFADEILEQQAEYRRRGGRFIIPIPEPRIV